MVRNFYLVVVMSMFFAVAILIGSASWKIYWTALRPLLQALSGIH